MEQHLERIFLVGAGVVGAIVTAVLVGQFIMAQAAQFSQKVGL